MGMHAKNKNVFLWFLKYLRFLDTGLCPATFAHIYVEYTLSCALVASTITYLLPREHVLIEIILNLLICNVNAQLLKGVLFEIFEAKYIKDANVQLISFPPGRIETVV